MKKYVTYAIAVAMSIMLAGLVAAAETDSGLEDADLVAEQSSEALLEGEGNYQTAVELEGLPVVLLSGEEVGKMGGVTIDEQTGLIHYFTFTKDEGAGDIRQISVPYGALQFYSDRAILIVDREILDSVPEQAQLSDAQYQDDLESHYGVAPAW